MVGAVVRGDRLAQLGAALEGRIAVHAARGVELGLQGGERHRRGRQVGVAAAEVDQPRAGLRPRHRGGAHDAREVLLGQPGEDVRGRAAHARYLRDMPRPMDDAEWRAFVSEGTRTGKLATVRHDGRPHVVPIWFVLDGDDFVFNTGEHSIKGRALARNGIAALCVDDARPPYAFVSVTGTVTITTDRDDTRRWATAIGERYMGADRAAEFGERNAVDGELLVRLHADHVFAQADIAGYS